MTRTTAAFITSTVTPFPQSATVLLGFHTLILQCFTDSFPPLFHRGISSLHCCDSATFLTERRYVSIVHPLSTVFYWLVFPLCHCSAYSLHCCNSATFLIVSLFCLDFTSPFHCVLLISFSPVPLLWCHCSIYSLHCYNSATFPQRVPSYVCVLQTLPYCFTSWFCLGAHDSDRQCV